MKSLSSIIRELDIRGWNEDQPTVFLKRKSFASLASELAKYIPLDEDWYLSAYPDVREAVLAGTIRSARDHFIHNGFFEDRLPEPPRFDAGRYLDIHKDLEHLKESEDPNSAAYEHYMRHGYPEGREIE